MTDDSGTAGGKSPEDAEKVSSPENREQVAARTRRNRLIFVPSRQAASAAWTAQTPQSGVCHQSEGAGSPLFVQQPLQAPPKGPLHIIRPFFRISFIADQSVVPTQVPASA